MNFFTDEMRKVNEGSLESMKRAEYRLAEKCMFCSHFDLTKYPLADTKLGPCSKWGCWVDANGICKKYE